MKLQLQAMAARGLLLVEWQHEKAFVLPAPDHPIQGAVPSAHEEFGRITLCKAGSRSKSIRLRRTRAEPRRPRPPALRPSPFPAGQICRARGLFAGCSPPRAAQVSDQPHCYALAPSRFLLGPSYPGGIPAPPHLCVGNKSRLERTASRPHRTRFEPPKATDAGPNLCNSPNAAKTSWPPGFRTRKISRSANGAISDFHSRETQTAASIDEDALGRLSKEPYSIRPMTRSLGSKSRRLSAHTITSLPSKTLSDNSEPISRRQIIKDQQNAICGVTA